MKKLGSLFLFFIVQAYACKTPIATTSVYYLPDAKKICGAYGVRCTEFLKEVDMQGSGKITATKILRAPQIIKKKGKKIKLSRKEETVENCSTTRGASGKCQIPYVSVAADRRFYNMGDIISMPALKGKRMTLRNGKAFIHPGYLIVHDVGGAIDGSNRFDMFSDDDLMNPNNAFGYKADEDLKLYHTKTCTDLKSFSRIKPTDAKFAAAMEEIRNKVGTAIDDEEFEGFLPKKINNNEDDQGTHS